MPESLKILLKGDASTELLVILTAVVALLLLTTVILMITMHRQSGRIAALARGESGQPLESILVTYMDSVDTLSERVTALEKKTEAMHVKSADYLDRFNVVHYDAFDNIGGHQSFSLALLNSHDTGVVITSVYSRNHMRVYAKGIEKGRPTQSLSEDEEHALERVLTSSPGMRGA